MKTIIESVSIAEKGPPSQKRIQIYHYMSTLCGNKGVSTYLVKSGVLSILAKQLKDMSHVEVYV